MVNLLIVLLGILCISYRTFAQENLTKELLEKYAFRFVIDDQNNFDQETSARWKNWIGENQFIGLAEVHNSRQLSFFTTAMMSPLAKAGFKHFAIELGPNSASMLNELGNGANLGLRIKELNRSYGKNSVLETPLIFVNKEADALFLNKASELGFKFWGLDQEYAHSFEMLLDRMHSLVEKPSHEQITLYNDSKKLLNEVIYKKSVDGKSVYCWYQTNRTINEYFNSIKDKEAAKIVEDIKVSWDIYCKSATGKGSNQQRADYMKQNFESYYSKSEEKKVFLKLGGAHLTHNISPFRVDDMGKFLHELAAENKTGFLSIYHLIAYRNGESNIGKPDWKRVDMFLELGQMDKWTVVDLRPLSEMLSKGLLNTNEVYAYLLMSYDLLLISPDDQYDKANY